jgi:hypothetical protein
MPILAKGLRQRLVVDSGMRERAADRQRHAEVERPSPAALRSASSVRPATCTGDTTRGDRARSKPTEPSSRTVDQRRPGSSGPRVGVLVLRRQPGSTCGGMVDGEVARRTIEGDRSVARPVGQAQSAAIACGRRCREGHLPPSPLSADRPYQGSRSILTSIPGRHRAVCCLRSAGRASRRRYPSPVQTSSSGEPSRPASSTSAGKTNARESFDEFGR